jgi:hypothetical protein
MSPRYDLSKHRLITYLHSIPKPLMRALAKVSDTVILLIDVPDRKQSSSSPSIAPTKSSSLAKLSSETKPSTS